MKNKGPEREDLREKQKNDTIYFLCLCGKKDREFLRIPDRERKTDDYVRLMCISLIFGFHYPAMRLLRESEDQKRVKAVLARLSEIESDYGLLRGWIHLSVKFRFPDFADWLRNVGMRQRRRRNRKIFIFHSF